MNSWLHVKGSSVSKLCDNLGLPVAKNSDRTIEDCKHEVREYFNEKGVRPNVRASKEWQNVDAWLHTRDTSLTRLCDDLKVDSLRLSRRRSKADKALGLG